jgi:hypothetical protein
VCGPEISKLKLVVLITENEGASLAIPEAPPVDKKYSFGSP